MAKFKPAGSRKSKPDGSVRNALPCLFLVLMGVALLSFLFYEILKSGL